MHGDGQTLAANQGITVADGDRIAPDDQPFAVTQAQKREREQQHSKQIG